MGRDVTDEIWQECGIGNVALMRRQVLTRRDIDDMIKEEFSHKANAKDLIDDGEKPDECGSRSSA